MLIVTSRFYRQFRLFPTDLTDLLDPSDPTDLLSVSVRVPSVFSPWVWAISPRQVFRVVQVKNPS